MSTAEQKEKKLRIDSDGDTHMDSAPPRSIKKLQEIQDELEKVDEEAIDKVLEVEQKYNEIRRQVYVQRNEIIKKIPDFWLTAFLSHPMLGELLTKDDQEIFKHLVSVDVDESKDIKSGYSITLTFSSNPYFKDTKLTKTCSFSDDGKITIKATSINWKDGMDIANGKAYTKDRCKRLLIDESSMSHRSFLMDLILAALHVAHKQHQLLNAPRHGQFVLAHHNRETRLLNPTYGLGFFGRSFFTWFNDAKNKSFANGVTDEVADIIKEELWPNPLKYFNNEAEDEFEEDEEDEEESDDDDDDDDNDDDGQDEEEEDEEK